MRKLLVGIITWLFATASTFSFAETPSEENKQLLVAQTTKKKRQKSKKTKVRTQDEAFGPDGIEAMTQEHRRTGVHGAQEGIDSPYKAEINVRSDFSFLSVEVGDADPHDNSIINLGVEWLFIFGSFAFGPDFAYNASTTVTSTTTTNPVTNQPTTTISKSSTSATSAGGLFKWNFGNIDKQNLVPFAYAGFAYQTSSSEAEDAKAIKKTGSIIRVGGGMNLFLDSNVAFNPRAEFRMESDKDNSDENAIITTTNGIKILFGIAVFI